MKRLIVTLAHVLLAFLISFAVCAAINKALAFDDPYEEASPDGDLDDISTGDDQIRQDKRALRERLAVDHDFEQTETSATIGKHKQISLIEAADIGTGAAGLPILGAQTVSGKPELVYTDEDNNDVQITSGGKIGGGVVLPPGAVFYMLTGSCPTGTTDVTATYSNKFIKINATQGTSSGTVLTGATDSHVLNVTEIPSHTHGLNIQDTASSDTPARAKAVNNNGVNYTETSNATGGDGGHTHTLSAATTLEPSSVTCKLCQVN